MQGAAAVETGERQTKENFDRFRSLPDPKLVISYQNTGEMVNAVITHPFIMIASDRHTANTKGCPCRAETYSRLLACHVHSKENAAPGRALLGDVSMGGMPQPRGGLGTTNPWGPPKIPPCYTRPA